MKLLKNPYACVVCQKSFSITTALLEHVKTQHIPLKSPETKNEKERIHDKAQNNISRDISNKQSDFKPKMNAKEEVIKFKNLSLTPNRKIDNKNVHISKKYGIMKAMKNSVNIEEKLSHRNDLIKVQERVYNCDKSFICKFCRKDFKTKAHLVRLENIHIGENTFYCKYCKKKYYRKDLLKVHERVHVGSKPFICKFCKKVFISKAHLERHDYIHTRKKSYSCMYCNKNFAEKII